MDTTEADVAEHRICVPAGAHSMTDFTNRNGTSKVRTGMPAGPTRVTVRVTWTSRRISTTPTG
jgi:hypothetical protein